MRSQKENPAVKGVSSANNFVKILSLIFWEIQEDAA